MDIAAAEQHVRRMPRWVAFVDYLILILLALVAYIVVFGGIRWTRGDLTLLSLRSPSRLLFLAALFFVLRQWRKPGVSLGNHAVVLRERILRRLGRVAPASWRAPLSAAVSITLMTRVSVILIGILAVAAIGYPAGPPPAWNVSNDIVANLPARWDTGWYLGIARTGYEWNPANHGQQNLAFFPGFPMLMRGVAHLTTWTSEISHATFIWSGVAISVLAFFLAMIYLYALTRDRFGDDAALAAAVLLATYPFAVFYSAAYTESLFLLAVVGTFYHYSRGQLWAAAAWGLLTGLTRPNGWMLSASLGLLAVPALGAAGASVARLLGRAGTPIPPPISRQPFALVAAASAPVIGLCVYCGYIYWLTGSPFTWAGLMTYWQRDFDGVNKLEWEFSVFSSTSFLDFAVRNPTDILNGAALLFGVASIIPVARRLGLAYAVFVLFNIALPALSGGLESIGRYSSVLFPSFMWLGLATRAPARAGLIAMFAVFQGLAAAMFFTWRGIY